MTHAGTARLRSRRPTTWIAVAMLALALAMVVFSLSSLVMPGADQLPDRPGVANFIAAVCAFVTLPVVGAALAILRPANPIGWLFLVCGLGFVMGIFSTEYVSRSTILGADLPLYPLVDWIGTWSGVLAVGLAGVWIPLLFPDGHLPGSRWRPVAWGAAIGLATVVVGSALSADGLRANPIAAGGMLGGAAKIAANLPLFQIFASLALVSVAVRFRRSRGVERQQLKWFLAAVAFLVIAVIIGVATEIEAVWYLVMLGLASLPVAAAIAILRYRLYDIDRIISRTVSYAAVTLVLGAVFVGLILALQGALTMITQGQTVAVAASTLAVFALFQPLRRRIQQAVDRQFDRAKFDADMTIRGFSRRLRDDVDLDVVRREIARTADATVRPTATAVWLRGE